MYVQRLVSVTNGTASPRGERLGHTGIEVQVPDRILSALPGASFAGEVNSGHTEQHLEETFVTYTIAEPCVDIKDKACIEECPVDCIYEGARMLYIHPDECVDCGACEPVCPVEAIFYEDDVPEQWSHYTQINADFFAELGSPGGAAKVGMTENDPQVVMDLAPQGEGA